MAEERHDTSPLDNTANAAIQTAKTAKQAKHGRTAARVNTPAGSGQHLRAGSDAGRPDYWFDTPGQSTGSRLISH